MSLGRKEASEQAISEDRRGRVEARTTEALGKLMAEVEPCLQGSEQSASPASWTLVQAWPFAAPCASSRADQACSRSSPVEAMLIEEAVAELEVLVQGRLPSDHSCRRYRFGSSSHLSRGLAASVPPFSGPTAAYVPGMNASASRRWQDQRVQAPRDRIGRGPNHASSVAPPCVVWPMVEAWRARHAWRVPMAKAWPLRCDHQPEARRPRAEEEKVGRGGGGRCPPPSVGPTRPPRTPAQETLLVFGHTRDASSCDGV